MNLPNQSMPVSRNEFGPVANSFSHKGIDPSACIGLSVNSQGKVCIGLPIIGTRCIPLRTPLPRGTAVRACITKKTGFLGIPTGVCVKITALGRTVANPCFGL